MNCSTPGFLSFTISQNLLKLMSIELVMLSNHLILCSPLLLLPSIFPRIRVFSNNSVLHIGWPKYWSFSISPSKEYHCWLHLGLTGLISLKSKGRSRVFYSTTVWKASILQFLTFFMVQLSHLYMTTGKNIGSTMWSFAIKVMSLLSNMLSRFFVAFLTRSKCLLISWLQSKTTVILEPKKIKSVPLFTVSPSICHKVLGQDAMILAFWMLSYC